MNRGLVIAAVLIVLTGFAHSVLGERYILMRLFRRQDLPALLGSDWFTRRTLRFAWHLTSLAWWGFAALLLLLAQEGPISERIVLRVIGATCFASAAVTAFATKGKHLAWAVFVVIGALAWLAA